jgi:hypothetical protein
MQEDSISEVIMQHNRYIKRSNALSYTHLGIPPNYADEELLKMFLNNVISKGLNEENDFSYGRVAQLIP